MKIFILPNLKKTSTLQLVDKLCAILQQENCEIICTQKHKDLFSGNVTCFENRETAVDACDIIIAVGGDGTVIKTAKLSASRKKPVLGINAGKFGFTASLEADELSELRRLFIGDYSSRPRMMLSVECYSSNGTLKASCRAINEIALQKDITCSMIDISMQHHYLDAMNFCGDGLIISTPTGSTGYSLSAGGPVVDPALECFIATPVCAHSVSVRSTIFSADTQLSVKVKNFSEVNASQSFLCSLLSDGEYVCRIDAGDTVLIRKSEDYAHLISLKNISFANQFLNKFGR